MGFFDGGLGSIVSSVIGGIGGQLGRESSEDAGNANAALQREFAQNGIRWKVEDAKAAGIHPLFALGANTMAAAPSYVGNDYSDFSRAGQDIGRAIDSTRTGAERTSARLEALALDRGELENELLRSQISRINQQSGPPGPGGTYNEPGQTGSGIKIVPRLVTAGDGQSEAGEGRSMSRYTYNNGESVRAPSTDFAQAIEDSPAHWYYVGTRTIPDMAWQDMKYVAQEAAPYMRRAARYHSDSY